MEFLERPATQLFWPVSSHPLKLSSPSAFKIGIAAVLGARAPSRGATITICFQRVILTKHKIWALHPLFSIVKKRMRKKSKFSCNLEQARSSRQRQPSSASGAGDDPPRLGGTDGAVRCRSSECGNTAGQQHCSARGRRRQPPAQHSQWQHARASLGGEGRRCRTRSPRQPPSERLSEPSTLSRTLAASDGRPGRAQRARRTWQPSALPAAECEPLEEGHSCRG